MLCDSCGENEASLHFTKIVNGEKEERHLCESCAGNDVEFDISSPFSMHKLFTGIIDGLQGDIKQNNDLKCDNCGLSYIEFKNTGKLGCSKCYGAFKDKLPALIDGLQGSRVHRGKIPKSSSEEIKIEIEIRNLQDKLDMAVSNEEYEKAAEIRDEIRELNSIINERSKSTDSEDEEDVE